MHLGLRLVFGVINTTIWPIRTATLERLIDALLERDASHRADRLRPALENDPALAWWTELSSSGEPGADRTLASTAKDLTGRLSALLVHLSEDCNDEPIAWDDTRYRRQLAVAIARYRFEFVKWRDTETPEVTQQLAWGALVRDIDPAFAVGDDGKLTVCPTRADTPEWLLKLDAPFRAREYVGFVEPDDAELQLDSFQLATPLELRRLGLLAKLCFAHESPQRYLDQAIDDAKLTALAEFAAGAGHEMNNPLAVISGRAQLLLRGETDEARRADLALIKAQATRVHEMIADLMLFARPPAPVKRPTDLAALIRATVDKLRASADQKHAQIILKLPDVTVSAMVDEAQLCVVIRALVENAINAVDDGGRITIEFDETLERIQLIVRDNGPGISAEERGLIFDPYYSGRQAGRGLGMGLPKCWRIVRQHGGQLTVHEAAGGGAEFEVTLPTDCSGPL